MNSCRAMNSLPRPLEFAPGVWRALMEDLGRRSAGEREAGAFLCRTHRSSQVCRWICYEELDPRALHYDYIRLETGAFARLADVCSLEGLIVIADIHSHPGGPVQSESDRRHPMIGIAGHVALIAPRFASGIIRPRDVSFNWYRGNHVWKSYVGLDAATLITAP